MLRATILTLLALLTAALPASAQRPRHHRTSKPNCSKGVQCGNTCIPAGRQCHVGDAPSSEPSAEPANPLSPSAEGQIETANSDGPVEADGDEPATVPSFLPAVQRDDRGRIKRSDEAKRAFMGSTGHPKGWPGHVVDHIVPLACGGADDPSNMQWQTVEEAKAKDKVERQGCSSERR